jgi:hypothetical protein
MYVARLSASATVIRLLLDMIATSQRVVGVQPVCLEMYQRQFSAHSFLELNKHFHTLCL